MIRVSLYIILLLAYSLLAQNHAEFIDQDFKTGKEVTETCLMCHDDVAEDIMHTQHWNWLSESFKDPKTGKTIKAGKANAINNFCIGVESNHPRCTSCHIGYGWKDASFDFSDPTNIDCLICHDMTETYNKIPTGAGMPAEGLDLKKIAQSVGNPKRWNCGICHFDGGGGTGVKHGDMDDMLYKPTAELDVHMGGKDFQCTECHGGDGHNIKGASHSSMQQGTNHISCTDCHDENTHERSILNKHIDAVACETCHIPEYGRGLPTKTYWDWSTAGKDITPEKDKYGYPKYDKKKGDFVWSKNVKPYYTWYNGTATYIRNGDKVTAKNGVYLLNEIQGNISEKNAKIAPFKVMKGKQPYDPVNQVMVVPNLFGKEGFWKTFNWQSASEIGMKKAKIDFSGKIEFVETEMFWPINHMVPPAEEAVKCLSCHGKRGTLMDWEELGYPGDPIKIRGREHNKLVKN